MAITAAVVKELRERTGCGMMDCKRALTETNGDMDKAVEYLREKGLATATKKSGRIASEGIVYTYVADGIGVMVEVNSESDFVAKNAEFMEMVQNVALVIA
ncbi:MAG: translation elongation factor Ts, partial [Phascolarctobacterium sp.]|nr:translation elongation factor Ts [Phascolarctobacterium sp.]